MDTVDDLDQAIRDSLKDKELVRVDEIENPEVRALIAECLDHDPNNRPSAQKLVASLEEMHSR